MTNDDEVMAFIEHALMEETRSYVERGRTLRDFGSEEVLDLWVAYVERWFHHRSDSNLREMDDAASELRLRELPIPEDRLGPVLEQLREERMRDQRPFDEETRQQLRDYLEARDKPQN